MNEIRNEEDLRAFQAQEELKEAAKAWLYGRLNAYPPLPEQLDLIYHEGLDAWKAKIKSIKDAYPKPASS